MRNEILDDKTNSSILYVSNFTFPLLLKPWYDNAIVLWPCFLMRSLCSPHVMPGNQILKIKLEQGLTSNCRLSSGSVSASSAGMSEALLLPELMNSITCSSTSGLCSVASSNKPEQHVSCFTGHFLFSYSASKSTTLFRGSETVP